MSIHIGGGCADISPYHGCPFYLSLTLIITLSNDGCPFYFVGGGCVDIPPYDGCPFYHSKNPGYPIRAIPHVFREALSVFGVQAALSAP